MLKKMLMVLIVSLCINASAHQAHAFVQGQWNMNVTEKISAKVKNVATAKYTDNFSDVWSFSNEGQFAIDGLQFGIWAVDGKKFVVDLDESLLGFILAANLQGEGFPSDTVVAITSIQASGTMKKDGSLKGKYKFTAEVTASGVTGTLKVNGKFTGVKIADNPTDNGTEFTISEYFPLGQGDTWTYLQEDDDLTVKTIAGTENIKGVNAAKIIDEDGDYYLWSNSNGLVWYKEYDADDIPGCGWEQLIFNPPIYASGPVVSVGSVSASVTALTETDCTGGLATASISYEFRIEGIEDVTVPAGTFTHCLRIKGTLALNGGTQATELTIWLAKGVGEVKEISIDKQNGVIVNTWTNDLVSAVVGGVSYP